MLANVVNRCIQAVYDLQIQRQPHPFRIVIPFRNGMHTLMPCEDRVRGGIRLEDDIGFCQMRDDAGQKLSSDFLMHEQGIQGVTDRRTLRFGGVQQG